MKLSIWCDMLQKHQRDLVLTQGESGLEEFAFYGRVFEGRRLMDKLASVVDEGCSS